MISADSGIMLLPCAPFIEDLSGQNESESYNSNFNLQIIVRNKTGRPKNPVHEQDKKKPVSYASVTTKNIQEKIVMGYSSQSAELQSS